MSTTYTWRPSSGNYFSSSGSSASAANHLYYSSNRAFRMDFNAPGLDKTGMSEAARARKVTMIPQRIQPLTQLRCSAQYTPKECGVNRRTSGRVYPRFCVNSNEAVQNANQLREKRAAEPSDVRLCGVPGTAHI